ncbi:MAG: DUF2066 domain-containing protein, partial [Steroidobacter sp.]
DAPMTSPRWKSIAIALLIALTAVAARAVTVEDLYEGAQPVGASRDAAFVEALKTVVVRVSGQRDAVARLGDALNNPRKYVQRFGFTADDVLQVGFDSVAIDQLLADAGLPIWGRERPTTLVMLDMEQPDGSTRWVSAQSPPTEREVIAKAARDRGLPLIWAAMDTQDRMHAGSELSAEELLQTAQRYGANAALRGRMRGGSVRWTLASIDGAAEASGGLEDGVHLAADAFARVFATSGSSLGNVTVEVTGIADLSAYATTLNYLESMTLVRGVALEQVAGDAMRFRLAVRGDAETLRRAIALDDRLAPQMQSGDPTASADERLQFRYQP